MWKYAKILTVEFPAGQQAIRIAMAVLLECSGSCLYDEQVAALLVQRERKREREV